MTDAKLTKGQLDELRRALLERRRELVGQLAAATQALGDSAGAESEPMDEADRTSELDERTQRSARSSDLLDEIDAALRRLDEGTYGLSEDSGEPIGYERLRALPWARRTAREEEEIERA
jgi:DnaK suppressor protein